MDYKDFYIDKDTKINSLKILINQCWKTLPIFEGKDKNNLIVHSREEAYNNYQKHLIFLTTKILGASEVWKNNQHYLELLYMVVGMKNIVEEDHNSVKYLVHHCTKLLNNMIEEIEDAS